MGDNNQGGYGQYNPYGAQQNPYASQQQGYGYGGDYAQAGAAEQGNGGYGMSTLAIGTMRRVRALTTAQKCPTCSSPAARPQS